MSTKLSLKPTQPVITLLQAKGQLRIKEDEIFEDEFLLALIPQATRIVELLARRQFITATYIKSLQSFNDDRNVKHPGDHHDIHNHHDHEGDEHDVIILENPPLQSVEEIKYIDPDGNEQILDLNDSQLDTFNEPGRIKPAFGKSWPSTRNQFNSVLITYKAGFGDDESTMPDEVKRAVKLMVSHYFENRDLVLTANDVEQIEFPIGLMTIINQFALPEFQ